MNFLPRIHSNYTINDIIINVDQTPVWWNSMHDKQRIIVTVVYPAHRTPEQSGFGVDKPKLDMPSLVVDSLLFTDTKERVK